MFSALTITSTKQGFAFDAAASASAFAVIERLADLVVAVVRKVRQLSLWVGGLLRLEGAGTRP